MSTIITPKLARLLREHGHDALSAHEVGNAELSDPEQMSFATSQGRALLTCNAQDFTSPAPLITTGTSGAGPTSRGFVAPGVLNREARRRTRGIERAGQDKIVEVRKGRRARRGIQRDPRGSGFPRSWRGYSGQRELSGRVRQMSVEFQCPLYGGVERSTADRED